MTGSRSNAGSAVLRSELIDLSEGDDSQCFDWKDYPGNVEEASGGLIGDTVLICGGAPRLGDIHDQCYGLSSRKSTFITNMSTERWSAGSIVLDEKILWISGGLSGGLAGSSTPLSSSDLVTLIGSTPGPELPMKLASHAKIAINDSYSMIIGGSAFYDNAFGSTTGSTHYYNHKDQVWVDGPTLNIARRSHAAGIVTDQVTKKTLIIVSGGDDGNGLISTEILVENQWILGNCRYENINCY